MTRKTKFSYLKLFRGINELLQPYGPIRVERICVVFESAVWGAIRNVFPSVKVQGCGFHFYQAIFRKIQELGLSNLYRTNRKIQHTCRKLMTLNLLPHRFIPEVFYSMKANSSRITRPLFDYFEKNWLKNTVWGLKSWSFFYLSIRTNNSVESYHSRLKRLAKKAKLNLYLLIELLWNESKRVPMNCFLLATDKLGDVQKAQYASFTSTLMSKWEDFKNGYYSSIEKLYEDLTDVVKDHYKYRFNTDIKKQGL